MRDKAKGRKQERKYYLFKREMLDTVFYIPQFLGAFDEAQT